MWLDKLGSVDPDGLGIVPYAGASAFLALPAASISLDGKADTATARTVRDAVRGIWGGTVAVGAEYRMSPHFALSGEFGARPMFVPGRSEYNSPMYRTKVETNLGPGMTYTALGLNFYFQAVAPRSG